MWSHTIQSSKSKAPTVSNEKSTKANGPASTNHNSDVNITQSEGMIQGFDDDGFSKTSRVRASKKPLTVAKAPILGRTTSSKSEGQTTTTKDNVRPTPDKRSSRTPVTQPGREATAARAPKIETPTKPASSATRAKAPVLSSRTKKPIQAVVISRAGTPVSGRPVVSSPKTIGNPRGQTDAERPLHKVSSPTIEEDGGHSVSKSDSADSVDDSKSHLGEVEGQVPINREEIPSTPQETDAAREPRELPADEEGGSPYAELAEDNAKTTKHIDREAHEELNREIVLRNDIINGLRQEQQALQLAHERKVQEMESKAAAQARSLRSELDSVRGTLVDLDDTHRSTLEKHDSLLRSRDKIIQNLSKEADGMRLKHGINDTIREQAGHDPVEKTALNSQSALLLSKNEEIQSLSEVIQDLRNQLEAADTARAKEIYDELLRSKDKEIASVSGVVRDLKGELEATDKPDEYANHAKLLRSKDDEIKSLSERVRSLQEKLEVNDKDKEQEVSHSVLSLRGEFQDLQNKHKRKIEDLEAAATARVEAIQSDYDELLRSRDQEIRDTAAMTQDLQKEIETAREDQKQGLRDADMRYEQQLQDAKARFEEELRTTKTTHEQELEAIRTAHHDINFKYTSEIQELTRKHRDDLESARTEQQAADINHQQELRDVRRKHENALEAVKSEVQDELREEIKKLEREVEDSPTKHDKQVEQIQNRHQAEMGRTVRNHEQAMKDVALQHERDLEEASTTYQKELADVERLRSQGSDDVSEQHENQLKVIAGKYQQEIDEAAHKYDDMVSNYEQQLQETKASHEGTRTQAEKYQHELEETRQKHRALEDEKRIQDEKFLGLTSAHDEDFKAASSKHQEDIDRATAKHDELSNLLERQKREHQEKVIQMEQEIEHVRKGSASAAAEVEALKASLEELELSQRKIIDDTRRTHQQEIQDNRSRHEHELGQLRAEFEAAAAEIVSLNSALKEADSLRMQADENMTEKYEQVLRDAASKHDQAMMRLRSEHDTTLAEMTAVQIELQNLNNKLSDESTSLTDSMKKADLARTEAGVEIALLKDKLELASRENRQFQEKITDLERHVEGLEGQLSDFSKDIDRQRSESAVEITLHQDKLELAHRETQKHKETIVALQEDIERLRNQLTESSEDLDQKRHEAAVEIALLKDRLELAELQKQSASEDMSLSRNEANVEIAQLKDKLELSDLQSQEDKKTITALEERLQKLQAQPLDTIPYVHHQLREEYAMLARHHAANVADVEALKASILAERQKREEEWKKRALRREHLSQGMQGIQAEFNGIVGVH